MKSANPLETELPGANYTPAESLPITSLEQLKTISEPLRLKILEIISDKAHSASQIAKLLNLPPTRLYYHINALEEQGFICLVETRVKSGIIEKYYRPTARSFHVDRSLLGGPSSRQEMFQAIIGAVFDPTVEDLSRSLTGGLIVSPTTKPTNPKRIVLTRAVNRLALEKIPQFIERLEALIDEFKASEDVAAGQSHTLMIAFFPRIEIDANPNHSGADDDN